MKIQKSKIFKPMKRNLILLVIIVIAVIAGLYYFTQEEDIFSKETSLYKAVPLSAPVFIELNSLKSIPFDNEIVKDLLATGNDVLFLKKVSEIDSIIQNNKEIQNGLRNESGILAFDFVGESQVFPLLIYKAENENKQISIRKLISALYPENRFSYEEKEYSNYKISSVSGNQEKDIFHFSFTDGLWIGSPKMLLVEESLRQLSAKSITDDMFFKQVNKTVSAQSKIAWYINHQTFPELVGLWLNGISLSHVNEFGETVRSNYKAGFNNYRKYAAWSELDVKMNEEEILMHGVSVAEDSLNHFLSVFDGQMPVRYQAAQVLPRNTSFFTSFSFSDKSLFFENLERFFEHTPNFYKREDRIKKIESGFRIDFKATFKELVKNELIVASTTIPTNAENKTTLFILETDGKSETKVLLDNLISSYAERKKVEFDSMKSVYEVDAERSYTIYKFPYPSMPGIWLGKPFVYCESRYAVFYKDYLVFSNRKEGLQEYLTNMVLGASLKKDVAYESFDQSSVSRANINSFVNINRILALKDVVFNKNVSKELKPFEDILRNFYALNWQVAYDNGVIFNSIHLSLNKNFETKAKTTWQSNIGNRLNRKPTLVTNHTDKTKNEIVLQDVNNNLYQISKEGRIQWSLTLDEPIISEIHQIDYYRNGKLQYLFNTRNKLYLLDRTGKNVAKFPVKLTSPASNGVSVFDYDNNRNYRFFVAGEDKKVYAYTKEGKKLNGWNFGKTDHLVKHPVRHLRINKRDFIVFKDKSRVYIQNRRGATRVDTKVRFEDSQNNFYLSLSGTPKIVVSDKGGSVYYLFFDGKFSEIKTENFSEKHLFAVDDIDANGTPDFAFVEGKELVVYTEKGKKLYSRKFKNEIEDQPEFYNLGSNIRKLGIVESSANRIHLLDEEGKEHKGFPVQGNSPFTIGEMHNDSGQLNLLVGTKGGDLYNYSLN